MDIISCLQRRKLLGEIAVDILACLNVKDLHMAEDVSYEWRETVMNGKLWEKLFKRNVLLYPPWRKMNNIISKQNPNAAVVPSEEDDEEGLWHEQMLYRKACLLIEDSLQILENNWATGTYQEEIVHRGTVVGPVNSITFLMNEEHIVRHVDSERVFKFYNRWSLDLEEMIPSHTELAENETNDRYFVTCFDFNDELLVIGYGNGVVEVVDRKTTETLHSFRDFDWPVDQILVDLQDTYATEKVILSPKRKFLLSYLYTTTSFFLTLRKINSVNDMMIVHQLQLDDNVEELVNLYMDDLYTILFIRAQSGHHDNRLDHYEEIFEIRSTETFTPLHSIEVHDIVSAYHYLNGLLVIGSRLGNTQTLSVWEAKTGEAVRKIELDKDKMIDLRIISDKYVVSVSDTGELKHWDLQALLNPSTSAEKAVLHKMGSSKILSSCVGGGMVADEYQVVLFGFFRTVRKGQKENPIIVSLDFMKGQRYCVKKPLPQLY